MRTALAAAAGVLVLLAPLGALALQQPNGTTVPYSPPGDPPGVNGCSGGTKPSGLLPIFACQCTQPGICNIGAPCTSQTSCDNGQHGTCESTMWHSFNDNTCIPSNHSGLDPVAAAAQASHTFHPTCALTFTVVSRGNAMFQNVFGWYNATGHAPAPSDLHPMLGCTDGAGTSVVLDLTKEPGWLGGDIGFFLMTPESHTSPGTCASGNCCPTVAGVQAGDGYVYFTEPQYDPDQLNGAPFVHVLAYDSTIVPQKFYFGMEDTYGGGDDDFADLVTSVEGVECSGAGQSCDTGKPGACALGVTDCSHGQIGCQPVVQPKPEVCNGVDDDCDGMVDNGATCPQQGYVCYEGKCVPPCGGGEFTCPAPLACDGKSHLCVDAPCVGVTCPSGQICQSGKCGAPCGGVVCPHGQSCIGNACVDLCTGVSCGTGQACVEGVCVPGCASCGGTMCGAPLACDAASGACVDPSCPGGCPNGTYCSAGSCVDDCHGAKCPDGQTCQGGECVASGAGADAGLGLGGGGVGALDGGADEGGTAAGDQPWGMRPKAGCACDTAGSRGGPLGAGATLALGLALGLVARRSRRVCARRPPGRH